jgi:hypothetical protein
MVATPEILGLIEEHVVNANELLARHQPRD